MNQLEDNLRKALERREPPAGFSDRVMARIPERRPWFAFVREVWGRPAWVPALALMLLVLAGTGVLEYRREMQRRQEAALVREQLIYALQLTEGKVQEVRSKIFSSESRGGLL